MGLVWGCQKSHVRHPSKPRCTQISTLRTGRVQPQTAGHTPCWVTACRQNWCLLCANINSWEWVYFSSASECVWEKNDYLKPLQRGLIGSIQFPILLCRELPIVCQQGTGTLCIPTAKLFQQTLTCRFSLKRLTAPLIVTQSDTVSRWKKRCLPRTHGLPVLILERSYVKKQTKKNTQISHQETQEYIRAFLLYKLIRHIITTTDRRSDYLFIMECLRQDLLYL